jgi:hypothetical protein
MVPSFIAETPTIGLSDDSWRKLSASEVNAFARYLSAPEAEARPAPTLRPKSQVHALPEPQAYQPYVARVGSWMGEEVVSQQPLLRKEPRRLDIPKAADKDDLGWEPLESSFEYLMLCSKKRQRRPN